MPPLRARVDLRAMEMKGYSSFSKAPALLELPHQIVSCHNWTLVGGALTPLQRSSEYILQSQSTGQSTDETYTYITNHLNHMFTFYPNSNSLIQKM